MIASNERAPNGEFYIGPSYNKLVEGGYKIIEVQPFDLFPQTRHVENIVTFIR